MKFVLLYPMVKAGCSLILLATATSTSNVLAQSAAEEMARKLQNPLANIKAIMTDNSIAFDTGNTDGTSYGFQIQPVYAIDFPEKGFTMIPRAVVPILGLEPGTKIPPIGAPTSTEGSKSGIGDSIVQLFFAPHTEGSWKWGIGPQVSLPTHSNDVFKGPDWGIGVSGILTGNLSDNISVAAIVGNHWGNDGKFNLMTLHPMIFYNFPKSPGLSIAYNAAITADWEASSDNRWTVPLGLTLSKTWDMGDGHGFDAGIGPYYNVERPEGGARWQIRFGLNWLFP